MPKLNAQVGIRLPQDLKVRLERQARKEMISVSGMILRVMEAYLDEKEQEA